MRYYTKPLKGHIGRIENFVTVGEVPIFVRMFQMTDGSSDGQTLIFGITVRNTFV